MHWKSSLHQKQQNQPPSVIDLALKNAAMAFNEDSSASGHDEPWIQWYGVDFVLAAAQTSSRPE